MKISILAAFWLFTVTKAAVKPHNLTILGLVVKTGNGPKNGKACMLAQQMVLDDVNARNDILPGYNLVGAYEDEGPSSTYAVRAGVQFSRRLENEFISPITHGLSFTPGCNSLASYLLPQIYMVLIAQSCLSPAVTRNRKQYPNLYRSRISGELGNYAMAAFMKMNRWQKVAVYANADNVYNTLVAKHFNKIAGELDFEIVYFELGSGISLQSVQALKESGARITMIDSPELPVILGFLCFSHQVGLRDSRYVFLLAIGNIDPIGLAATASGGCTKDMVLEQFQRVVIVGAASLPFENYGSTTLLGYDINSFDAKFGELSNYAAFTDMNDRLPCYDRMLAIVLALNRTETKLGAMNLTLRDYKQQPKIVMQAANQSVFESDVRVLRSGRLKYDQDGEFTEANFVVTWRPSTGFSAHYKIELEEGADPSNVSAYNIRTLKIRLDWGTPDGIAPRDYSTFISLSSEISEGGTAAIAIFAVFAAFAKITLFILVLSRWHTLELSTGSMLAKMILVVGCSLLDASAIAFSLPATKEAVCLVRPFFTAAGLSLTCGLLFSRFFLIRRIMLQKRSASKKKSLKRPSSFSKRDTITQASTTTHRISLSWFNSKKTASRENVVLTNKLEFVAISSSVLFCILNLVILIIFAANDRPHRQRLNFPPKYDNQTDTWKQQYTSTCKAENQANYYAVLAVANFAIQLGACFLAYELRTVVVKLEDRFQGIAAANIATLFAATVCVLFIISSSTVSQQIALAVAGLIISMSSAGLVLGPCLSRSPKINAMERSPSFSPATKPKSSII